MVETWPVGLLLCFFWVVFVVLVLFSTIRLFFPPFNDDLGTMPTRRPYSWKGCVRSESSSCAGIGMLLFTEAHLEYNAGLVISIGNRSKHSPLEYDTTASTLAKNLQAGRLALVSRARPPVNPSDTATGGTLFTPFVGIAMQTALDLCMVWSSHGLYMCKRFWPSPVTSPDELGPGGQSSGHGNPIQGLSP